LRLLDVGAGAGILVEAATGMGIRAEGIEPSQWLQQAAVRHGCRVHAGVLPSPAITPPYDIVTMVDVIEHVEDPRGLLREAALLLAPDGVLAVVTPDAGSLMARLLGWRWWHYRIAHVGYFDRANLHLACAREGLSVAATTRPGWVFSLAYLRERLLNYVPAALVPKERGWMQRVSVPLNLGDSLMVLARRAEPAGGESAPRQ
jgi:SAM-dependent methyltransferase